MENFQNIVVEIVDQTAVVRINRESKLNALNKETIAELKHAVASLAENNEVRGLVLTGTGPKAFVAGADIQEFLEKSKAEAMELSALGHELMDRLANFPKPVIAAVNGFALGGGLELAMACHIRIASSNAKMGLPEVSLGLIPGYGGTQRLPQLVGKAKALEMMLSGEMIDAAGAYKWGLVNKVVEQEVLMEEVFALLNKMYAKSRNAIATAIEVVNTGFDAEQDGYRAEINAFGQCFGSDDFKEGVSAFLEKRKPDFK